MQHRIATQSDKGLKQGQDGLRLIPGTYSESNSKKTDVSKWQIKSYLWVEQSKATPKEVVQSKLFIKNMVSERCRMIVRAQLEAANIPYSSVDLGEVTIRCAIGSFDFASLKDNLSKYGLELMDDKRDQLIDQIRNAILEMIDSSEETPKLRISEFLSRKLNCAYSYLANIFSEVKGCTIQHFIIEHKIAKAKEFLIGENLPLSEIAWRLHYSSVAHLSKQFKKVTGLNPSEFRNLGSGNSVA